MSGCRATCSWSRSAISSAATKWGLWRSWSYFCKAMFPCFQVPCSRLSFPSTLTIGKATGLRLFCYRRVQCRFDGKTCLLQVAASTVAGGRVVASVGPRVGDAVGDAPTSCAIPIWSWSRR